MTSATEELRRLLDERGVEWTDRAEDLELTLAGFADTRWDANGFRWCYIENGGTATLASCRPMEIKGCTPEQAIASTLWSGVERSKTEHGTLTAGQAIAATLGSGTCPFAQPTDLTDGCAALDGGTRWERLFGTPERAAHTSWYMLMCKYKDCDECPIADGCAIATDIDCDDGESALLEWLRGDAE